MKHTLLVILLLGLCTAVLTAVPGRSEELRIPGTGTVEMAGPSERLTVEESGDLFFAIEASSDALEEELFTQTGETRQWSDEDFFGEDSGGASPELLGIEGFYQARAFYNRQCSSCHVSVPPQKYTMTQWPAIMARMGPQAGLNQEQMDLVLRYIRTSQINPEWENTADSPF